MTKPIPRELALLTILKDGEMKGRNLAKAFEKEHGGSISYGSLYITMRRLTEQGLVTASDGEDPNGPYRIFKLTEKGSLISR